jgi:hypothetical protein
MHSSVYACQPWFVHIFMPLVVVHGLLGMSAGMQFDMYE